MDLNDSADFHIQMLEEWLATHPQDSQARRDRVVALRRWKAHSIRVQATRAVWLAQKRDLLARCDHFGSLATPQPR